MYHSQTTNNNYNGTDSQIRAVLTHTALSGIDDGSGADVSWPKTQTATHLVRRVMASRQTDGRIDTNVSKIVEYGSVQGPVGPNPPVSRAQDPN